jgi:predicted RNase H-like nuclease (RuvC/YqgF family)
MGDGVESLTRRRGTLQNTVHQLERRRDELVQAVQEGENRIARLRVQLEAARVTEEQLQVYVRDRDYLHEIGIDIRDVKRVSTIFAQLAALHFSLQEVVQALIEIPSLQNQIAIWTTTLSELQTEVNQLTQKRTELTQEITGLEQRLQEIHDRLEQALKDEQRKIEESKQRIKQQLDKEHATEQQLADYVATRDALGKAGIDL